MKLTALEQQTIARRAIFYFDCYFGMNHEDSVIFTGDGVDDLDALIDRLTTAFATPGGVGVRSRFQVDVGSTTSSWKPFDLDDVRGIRDQYVEHYGEVNKPAVTRSRSSGIQIASNETPVTASADVISTGSYLTESNLPWLDESNLPWSQ
jgi:hypothetical protein